MSAKKNLTRTNEEPRTHSPSHHQHPQHSGCLTLGFFRGNKFSALVFKIMIGLPGSKEGINRRGTITIFNPRLAINIKKAAYEK
jgi:hypothetical protein